MDPQTKVVEKSFIDYLFYFLCAVPAVSLVAIPWALFGTNLPHAEGMAPVAYVVFILAIYAIILTTVASIRGVIKNKLEPSNQKPFSARISTLFIGILLLLFLGFILSPILSPWLFFWAIICVYILFCIYKIYRKELNPLTFLGLTIILGSLLLWSLLV
jgi:hypothetical protein